MVRKRRGLTAWWLAALAVTLLLPPVHAAAPRRRALLVSFDALGGERLERLLGEPDKLPANGLRGIVERGFFAVHSIPPTPALTAVSHITQITGALPRDTGIVSNWMLDPSKPFGTRISGFEAPIRADTLWEAARRQGKRVGVILFPGADGKGPRRTADWGMTWPMNPVAVGGLRVLAADAWQAPGPAAKSFSPARRARLGWEKTSYSVSLVALDTTDDGRVNYDRVRIEPGEGEASEVSVGAWFAVEVPAKEGRTGAWCKLLALAPDLSKSEVYLGDLGRNTGYPAAFVKEMDAVLGFWPGGPDSDAFGASTDRFESFLEQADRLADFVTRAALRAIARPDWDLLLHYQPQVDEVSHEFWLTDPGQPGFTFERQEAFGRLVDRGYALADRSAAALSSALAASDSIFVTSDHGMTAIWNEINPNEILRHAGFFRLTREGKTDPASDAVAIVSGGIAHVHVNPKAPPDTLVKVEQVFLEFRVRGETPWEWVVRREKAAFLGLDAPESGDLILLARPGFVMERAARRDRGPVSVADHTGAHGYWSGHSQVHATFLAAGPEIPRQRVPEIGSWKIAARVSAALGIEPPRQAWREAAATPP